MDLGLLCVPQYDARNVKVSFTPFAYDGEISSSSGAGFGDDVGDDVGDAALHDVCDCIG